MLLSSPMLLFFVHFTSVLAFLCLFSLVPSVSLCSCSSGSLSVLSVFVHFSSVFFLYYLSVVLPFFMAFLCSSWFLWVCIQLGGSTTYGEGMLKFPFSGGRSQVSLSSLCLCSPPPYLCLFIFRLCFFCIICLWFSASLWLFSVRPGFSGFVFSWVDQQPTVRGC